MTISDDPEVARRQWAAIWAKRKGRYSGGRGIHPGSTPVPTSRIVEGGEQVLKGVGKGLLIGGALAGATALGLGPVAIPAYKLYSDFRIAKAGYDAIKSYRNKHEFAKAEANLKREGAAQLGGNATEADAAQVANRVRQAAQDSGALDKVASETGVNPNIYGQMLEGSIQKGLEEGAGKLAGLVIGG